MVYKWHNVEDENIEDGEYELLDEEKPTSGWVGVPHNNPKRDPNYGKKYEPRLHMPENYSVDTESEYVTYGWADEVEIQRFLESTYGKVISFCIVIIIILSVWLIAVMI